MHMYLIPNHDSQNLLRGPNSQLAKELVDVMFTKKDKW